MMGGYTRTRGWHPVIFASCASLHRTVSRPCAARDRFEVKGNSFAAPPAGVRQGLEDRRSATFLAGTASSKSPRKRTTSRSKHASLRPPNFQFPHHRHADGPRRRYIRLCPHAALLDGPLNRVFVCFADRNAKACMNAAAFRKLTNSAFGG